MAITTVIFDIDGTLVDSNDSHVAAWAAAFADIGVTIPPALIHDQIGKGADNLVPALLPDADAVQAEALGEEHGDIFRLHYLGSVRPFPGARDLLQAVRDSGRQVILASSAAASEVAHFVELLGASDLVSRTTSADDVARSKPAPDIIAAALGDVPPDQAIMVGDTPYDIAAAARCGVRTVALRSGGFKDDALKGAVAIYDDVAALLAGLASSPLAA